jgi:6-phosphofructo-2-kinase
MSRLMGAASSAPTSPTIKSNENRRNGEAHLDHGALPPPGLSLPPPGVPSLTNALRNLTTSEPGVPHPPGGVHYDSPYSHSLSSTAPTSPRM